MDWYSKLEKLFYSNYEWNEWASTFINDVMDKADNIDDWEPTPNQEQKINELYNQMKTLG